MPNILTGFLGALIALILSTLVSRINAAIRLNRVRRSIVGYLELMAKPKLEKYIYDSHNAIRHLQLLALADDVKKDGYDDMPMLTSEIIKSFSQNDLLVTAHDMSTYMLILDWYYCIDFLRKNMPRDIHDNFARWTNKHLEDKNIPAGEQQLYHVQTCAAIARERKDAITNIQMKIATAKNVSENLYTILAKLKGKSLRWVFNYFRSL